MKLALAVLLLAALVLIQCFIGGTRLVFSLPAYGILALAALASLALLQRCDTRPSFSCLAITAGFFAYILARAAFSPIDYLWWTDFYMVLGCLIVYLLTAFYITDARLRMVVLFALLALAFAEVLIGLRQFRGGDNWMPFGFIRNVGGHRASGMFISSIHLAGYLEAVGIMALSAACWSSWKTWARILLGYIALMCYAGVAITGSRGGYLSSVFSLLVFAAISLALIYHARPQKFHATLLLMMGGLAALVLGAIFLMSRSEVLQTRLSQIATQFDAKTRDIRIYNWQAALDQFRVAPIFGTGAGTHLYYGRLYRRPPLQADPIHAHSDYLELLAEYGIVGTLGMAAFLFGHLRKGMQSLVTLVQEHLRLDGIYLPLRGETLALQVGALSAVASYLAHSVVDFNLHIPGNALLFAFIFGMLASPHLAPAVVLTQSRWMLAGQLALPALGLWLGIAGLPKWPGEHWVEKARVALRERDFTASVTDGEKALTLEKRNPDLYYYLAGAYAGVGLSALDPEARRRELAKAEQTARAGLAIFPQDAHALVRLAQILHRQEQYQAARATFLQALELDSNLAVLHSHYAQHLEEVGREEEAEVQRSIAAVLGTGNLAPITRDPDKESLELP